MYSLTLAQSTEPRWRKKPDVLQDYALQKTGNVNKTNPKKREDGLFLSPRYGSLHLLSHKGLKDYCVNKTCLYAQNSLNAQTIL